MSPSSTRPKTASADHHGLVAHMLEKSSIRSREDTACAGEPPERSRGPSAGTRGPVLPRQSKGICHVQGQQSGLVKSCEHLAAGDRAVAGKLRSQDWTDSSGRKRRSIEVHADDIVFLGVKAFRSDENLAT